MRRHTAPQGVNVTPIGDQMTPQPTPTQEDRDSTPPGTPWWASLLKWAVKHTAAIGKLIGVLTLPAVAGLAIWAIVVGYRDWRDEQKAWRKDQASQHAAMIQRLEANETATKSLKTEMHEEGEATRTVLGEILKKLGRR